MTKPTTYLKSIGIDLNKNQHVMLSSKETGIMDLHVLVLVFPNDKSTCEWFGYPHDKTYTGNIAEIRICHMTSDYNRDPEIQFVMRDNKIQYLDYIDENSNYISDDYDEIKHIVEQTWMSNLKSHNYVISDKVTKMHDYYDYAEMLEEKLEDEN